MKKKGSVWVVLFIVAGCLLSSNIGQWPALASESTSYNGVIEYFTTVQVGSPVAGVLQAITAERGDMVRKGQVLAKLQSDVELATLKLARARSELTADINAKREELDYAKRSEDRIRQLLDRAAVSFGKWDEVETQRIVAEHKLALSLESHRLAKLELLQAEAAFQRLTLKSPISGIVVERLMSPGEYVEDRPIMKLAQIDPLNVEVIMPVQMLGRVKLGMEAIVIPESPFTQELKAKVTIVDRFVDAASSTFGVRLELPNPDHFIPPGLRCTVRFHIPSEKQ